MAYNNRCFRKKNSLRSLAVMSALAVTLLGVLQGLPSLAALSAEVFQRPNAVTGNYTDISSKDFTQELSKLLESNEEALEYVRGYPSREDFQNQPVDLTQDFTGGEVPLLMQWDMRWGYDIYGDNMIGLAGCGPVCLTMAYLYFTEDTSMNPREMAAFAYENGYYTKAGTDWGLWTEGVKQLGLKGSVLPLDENKMKQSLDEGGLIVCSMRKGDFTTTGHFILIRGYNEDGFLVNDPNRRSNSEKTWDFQTLKPQIKNLWLLEP